MLYHVPLDMILLYYQDYLLYQVKTQYLQILNIRDTSIKHKILGHSIPMAKCCMHMFDMVDTAFNYWRALIVC